ncbi:MAG: hypothetical protein AB7I50_18685 [Vicinamibacterales bacterium]
MDCDRPLVMRVLTWLTVASGLAILGGHVAAVAPDPTINEALAGRAVFPASNWWNLDVSGAPVDSRSAAFIDFVSGRSASSPTAVRRLHPDFGPHPYGIPYVVVPGSQPRLPLFFTDYGDESDSGIDGLSGFPIPDLARLDPGAIEGGVAGGGTSGDRHLLVIDRDRWLLYESWATRWNTGAGRWEAGSAAVFNLSTNGRRPDGWTSADAAGLAVFPGLVRYDEAFGSSEIRHAFRVTVRATNGYVWPASHAAGNRAGALPMGARLRLKSDRNLSGFALPVQRIFRAMQRYGLIVADNGSDMYISGTMDDRWDNDVLNPAFRSLTADDFDVIELGWGSSLAHAPEPPANLRVVQ